MMKISLKSINKSILFITLISLLVRIGHFYNSFVPKPYEALFAVLLLLTVLYLFSKGRLRDFFLSLPKKTWITVFVMVIAILFGWLTSLYLSHIPSTFNMVLEFGTFSIGLLTFILIQFYGKNDERFAALYLYALLAPVVFGVFAFFPTLAGHVKGLLAPDGNFIGFTDNVNIVSKVILVPALYFMTYAAVSALPRWKRLLSAIAAISMVVLLFWISSRGALLSLFAASLVLWIIYIFHTVAWKKALSAGLIILLIVAVGFMVTPYARKQRGLDRILHNDSSQSSSTQLRDKSLAVIVHESLSGTDKSGQGMVPGVSGESRLKIWPYYIRLGIRYPFGVGPDTHYQSNFIDKNGDTLSSGPHNTYLQIWFWGGWIGLACFLYLLYEGYRRLAADIALSFSPRVIGLLTILTALSVAIAFDDSLSLYCFWAILALAYLPWQNPS